MTGEYQQNVKGDLHQIELDKDGWEAPQKSTLDPSDCLSCLEAAEEGRCCNSCQELKVIEEATELKNTLN